MNVITAVKEHKSRSTDRVGSEVEPPTGLWRVTVYNTATDNADILRVLGEDKSLVH
jgi:hypothetical protein